MESESKDIDIVLKSRKPSDLRNDLKALEHLFSDRTTQIESLDIEFASSNEDPDQIFITYYNLNEEQLSDRKDYVESAINNYISVHPVPRVITEIKLHYAEVYANYTNINDIDSLTLLLEALMGHLETLDDNFTVQSLRFIDHINEDALHEPHFALFAIKE